MHKARARAASIIRDILSISAADSSTVEMNAKGTSAKYWRSRIPFAVPKLNYAGNVTWGIAYDADVIIRDDGHGKYFYDLTNLKENPVVTAALTPRLWTLSAQSSPAKTVSPRNVQGENIFPQPGSDVNQIKPDVVGADLKQRQLEVILKTNPADDARHTYHTWIRSADDIKTAEEAFTGGDYDAVNNGFAPDAGPEVFSEALRTGVIRVYSSYPIENGVFVTPSKMEAQNYAGEGKVHSAVLPVTSVAWIDAGQGQVADASASDQYSMSIGEFERDAYEESQFDTMRNDIRYATRIDASKPYRVEDVAKERPYLKTNQATDKALSDSGNPEAALTKSVAAALRSLDLMSSIIANRPKKAQVMFSALKQTVENGGLRK